MLACGAVELRRHVGPIAIGNAIGESLANNSRPVAQSSSGAPLTDGQVLAGQQWGMMIGGGEQSVDFGGSRTYSFMDSGPVVDEGAMTDITTGVNAQDDKPWTRPSAVSRQPVQVSGAAAVGGGICTPSNPYGLSQAEQQALARELLARAPVGTSGYSSMSAPTSPREIATNAVSAVVGKSRAGNVITGAVNAWLAAPEALSNLSDVSWSSLPGRAWSATSSYVGQLASDPLGTAAGTVASGVDGLRAGFRQVAYGDGQATGAFLFGVGTAMAPVGRLEAAGMAGIAADAKFAQKTYGAMFSSEGKFAGMSVDDVATALRSGAMKPADVPINYIVRDGQTIILNTRSAQALETAGIERSQWNGLNQTGNQLHENLLNGQLSRNRGAPFETVRRSSPP